MFLSHIHDEKRFHKKYQRTYQKRFLQQEGILKMDTPLEKQRRYTRIQLTDLGALSSLMGLKVEWPKGEQTRVLDLSYSGAALERPQQTLVHKQEIPLIFRMEASNLSLTAKLIWFNDSLVGCQFMDLKLEARQAVDRFLKAPLVGANLKPVNQAYFAAQDDFQFWFAGPEDCHVFLWTQDKTGELNKALVQWGEKSYVFEAGRLTCSGSESPRQEKQNLIQILSQVPAGKAPIKSLIETLVRQL